jgi:hypothetical protein
MIGSYFIGAHTNLYSERVEDYEISMSNEDCGPCEDLVGHANEISYGSPPHICRRSTKVI